MLMVVSMMITSVVLVMIALIVLHELEALSVFHGALVLDALLMLLVVKSHTLGV